MRRHLSARSRLTLLYASLFALGGAALALVTYALVAHTLHDATVSIPPGIQQEITQCDSRAQNAAPAAMQKCAGLYASGVQAGTAAALAHLLAYSLLSLAGVTLLAAAAGWIAAGRILRPVHRLTAAARAAGEQDLSQRIALQGPRDELRELADTFDTMLGRLDRAFTSQQQFIANASHGVLLERLVANLLDNAERYNIADGTITISTTAHDATSVLRVVNTGAAVPADMVERLFLPFTRLDDRTRHDGFGLGLTLVSSITTAHKGTVHATAISTGGLDITVCLPRRNNTATPASPAA